MGWCHEVAFASALPLFDSSGTKHHFRIQEGAMPTPWLESITVDSKQEV